MAKNGRTNNVGFWRWAIILLGVVVVAVVALAMDKTRGGISPDNGLLLGALGGIFAGGSQLYAQLQAMRMQADQDRHERFQADNALETLIKSRDLDCQRFRDVCREANRQTWDAMQTTLTHNTTILEANTALLQQLLTHVLQERG